MSRIVTVFGATGTQGSSVVNALLADGTFITRAVTRNVDSDAAKKLKARGAEVVHGDLSDKESIKKAIAGSEGVFGVTNTIDAAGLATGTGFAFEIDQGKNLVDACKETNVKFYVWSSLPSISKLSNGKYKQVVPFENKAVIDEYLQTSGIPYAILHTAGFAENIYNRNLHKVDTPSGAACEFVMARMPLSTTAQLVWIGKDLGPSVLALLKNYQNKGKEILGQTFTVVSQLITVEELVKTIQEAIGKPVTYKSPETSGIVMLDEMFDFLKEFDYASTMKVDPRLVALGVKPSTMKQFAEEELKPRYA